MRWVFNPHSGGVKVPESLKEPTRRRILAHAEKHYAGRYARLDVRFKGALCYIDAYMEPETGGARGRPPGKPASSRRAPAQQADPPLSVAPLRAHRWSVAFYTYSQERYEPSFFASGEQHGTPEEGLDVGAIDLDA